MKKQKGSKLGRCVSISKTQKEILDLLTKDYLTPPKVANYRHTSLRAVYKTINILEKKGLYNHENKKVQNADHSPPPQNVTPSTHKIRLHGQHFLINLIHKSCNYEKVKSKTNMINIDNNTIKLHNDSIEVYSNNSFISDDTFKATAKSINYFNKLFLRLESELDIVILKDRHQNIKLVQNHYAEINNELSKEVNSKGGKIRIYAKDDGKMWFEIDNSFNLNEVETTHPITAKQDMERIIKPFFDDLRNNFKNAPLMSEVLDLINKQAFQVNEIATGLNVVVKTLQRIIPQEQEQQDPKDDFNNSYIG